MPSLQETQNRLNSIKTTKKITKAMELVATSKLRKAKKNLISIQEYYMSVYDTFQKLIDRVKDVNKLFPNNPKKNKVYIIVTSDIGLCGGYNSNVLKLLKKRLDINDKIIILGNKGISHIKTSGLQSNIFKEYPSIGDQINYDIAEEVSKDVINPFLQGDISQVNLIHTKFFNSVTFEATNTQLLPIISSKEVKTDISTIPVTLSFEPSPEIVLKNSIPLYISAMIFGSMVESKVSEVSSRRIAMESATENAEDLIKELNLEYNRVRQSAITQEISEIVGGSESQ